MSNWRIGFVGTGANPDEPSAEGYAMAHHHADAYALRDDADLVACADIVPENARAFAAKYGIDGDDVYENHQTMLGEADLDVVSVCVPPAVHADVVLDCVRDGTLAGVHCEKPMALTWGNSQLMAREADRHDVQLTFNHQRRFGRPFRGAKELLDAGRVGDLQRVEFAAANVYDYGSHSIDLCNYFNDEASAEWVLGGIDYREENKFFGAHNENQATALWAYENGVFGLAVTGPSRSAVACHHRLVGTEGTIEVGPYGQDDPLRVRGPDTDGWETDDCDGETVHEELYIQRAIDDVLDALEAGRESELRARNALNATELIFGIWESSRSRGRVEFPLTIDDNPLVAMVESGALDPQPATGDDD